MLENKGKSGRIYDGRDFWQASVLDEMSEVRFMNTKYYKYSGVSESMYDSMRHTEERFPSKTCLVDDDGIQYIYSQFKDMVENFSRLLYHVYHITPGTHVGVLLYNSLEFCVTIYALSRLRAVAVPLSTKYQEPEIQSLIAKADLKGIIFHKNFAKWFQEHSQNMFCICMERNIVCTAAHMPDIPAFLPRPEDTAVLMFTSGTTSHSKGVLLKNFNIMHAIAVYQKIFQMTPEDISIIPVPAYHVTGLIAILGLLIQAGGCVYLHKFFDAERVLREIQENHITFLHASPTVFSMLLDKKEQYPRLPSLRLLACGSGNMPVQKLKALGEWLPHMEFCTVYGLTETSSPATIFPGNAVDSSHIGSSGCPVPGLQFKICDEEGRELPPRQTGTILIRGTTVITEYYRQEPGADSENWLDTGDLGYFDEDGYLYIMDRKKDMINRGGEKICSYDVENVLYTIPGIKEAAVVGIPDERYGEIPAAMVVREKGYGLTGETIRSHLKQKLAKFQIPVWIVFEESLPMTANMKVDKKRIRELLSER